MGRLTCNLVPWVAVREGLGVAELVIEKLPPVASARSRILCKPNPVWACSGLKPLPSSSSVSETAVGELMSCR